MNDNTKTSNQNKLWENDKDWESELKQFKPLQQNNQKPNYKQIHQSKYLLDNTIKESSKEWEDFTKILKPLSKKYCNIKPCKPFNNIKPSNNFKSKPNYYAQYKISLISRKDIKKIKSYKVKVDKTLDLHSHTVNQAEEKFYNFIVNSFHTNCSLIEIITGKGNNSKNNTKGIIKNSVLLWLEDNKLKPYILSYSPKYDSTGSYGAIYLFLRKNKNN